MYNREAALEEQCADLWDFMETADNLMRALDRCESNRGRFSCTPDHDCRCARAHNVEEDCECGADELNKAVEQYNEASVKISLKWMWWVTHRH